MVKRMSMRSINTKSTPKILTQPIETNDKLQYNLSEYYVNYYY